MVELVEESVITPEEMLALDDDKRYELIDGRLVEKEMGFLANRVAFVLACFLEAYLRPNKRGIATTEGTFDCFSVAKGAKGKVRSPDAAVILAGRFPNGEIPVGHSLIPPDIAIEVISPNEKTLNSDRKVSEYIKAGVKEVWSVNPELKTIRIKRLDGSFGELDENGILKTDLLPGFELKVGEIFQ